MILNHIRVKWLSATNATGTAASLDTGEGLNLRGSLDFSEGPNGLFSIPFPFFISPSLGLVRQKGWCVKGSNLGYA